MVTGERIGPVSDMANYINRAYIDVENASGVKFRKVFIETTLYRDDVVFPSVEPAIALSVLKTLQPHSAVKFASAIKRRFITMALNLHFLPHTRILPRTLE